MTKNLSSNNVFKILTLKGTRRFAQNDILVCFIKLIFFENTSLNDIAHTGGLFVWLNHISARL